MNISDNLQDNKFTDYNLLSRNGNLGFYNSCEVTTVYLFGKSSKKAYNYFSIFTYEDRLKESCKVAYLTEKLISISTEYSIGICRYYLSMDEALESFDQIYNSETLSNAGGILNIGKLNLINRQFVPPDGTIEVNLNKCLKNNFINGSYIYEFFDSYKPFSSILTKQQREKISEIILGYVPINLHVLQDRIGNIIFQFPSTLIGLESAFNKDGISCDIKLIIDKRIHEDNQYSILIMNEFDECMTGINFHDVNKSEDVRLYIGDTENLINIIILNNKINLVVYESKFSLIKQINFSLDLSSEFPHYRSINTSSGEVKINISTIEYFDVNGEKSNNKHWKRYAEERQYKERLKELELSMKFIQYGTTHNSEGSKAIEDVRKLINMYSEKQVMLWDPYLSADDILSTLYYCKQYGIEMRAITATSSKIREINSINSRNSLEWIKEQNNILNTKSNNYGVNLEVRCQHDQYGWNFHDRFLLFVMRNGTSRVWSLGTSINSLGKKHHIIQEVSHPQYIVDAFNELWDELNDKRCLLWKNK